MYVYIYVYMYMYTGLNRTRWITLVLHFGQLLERKQLPNSGFGAEGLRVSEFKFVLKL